MKAAFKEFAKTMIKNLQGDMEDLAKHSLKAKARELIRKDDKDRKVKRKAIKAARRKGRK